MLETDKILSCIAAFQRRYSAYKYLKRCQTEFVFRLRDAILLFVAHVKESVKIQSVTESGMLERTLRSQLIMTAMEEKMSDLVDLKFSRKDFLRTLRKLREIESKLQTQLQSLGGISLRLIFLIEFGDSLLDASGFSATAAASSSSRSSNYSSSSSNEWFNVMNREFMISSYTIYEKNCNPKEVGAPLTLVKKRKISSRRSSSSYPILLGSKTVSVINGEFDLDKSLCNEISSTSGKSFHVVKESNSTNLLRIASKFNISSNREIFIITTGQFKEDYFQNFRVSKIPFFKTQFEKIQNYLQLTAPRPFCDRWIRTVTLSDVLSKQLSEILESCSKSYSFLNANKNVPLSNILKEFVSGDETFQREMITAFFLAEEDSDMDYIGSVLVDIVTSESYDKLKRRSCNQLINSLPWFIRKKVLKSIDTKDITHMKILNVISKETSCDEPDISYETRIYVMKAPIAVKKKASDKLKEIQTRSGSDSQSKSQQYLDGLLRIPFGTYRKEPIFAFLESFRQEVSQLMIRVEKMNLTANSTTLVINEETYFIERLSGVCHNVNDPLCFSDIDRFFSTYEDLRAARRLCGESTNASSNVKGEDSVNIQLFTKDRWNQVFASKSYEELCSVVQKLKKYLKVRNLNYISADGEMRVLKTKTKQNGSFIVTSFEDLSESLACILDVQQYECKETYLKLLNDVFPELLYKRTRTQSMTTEFLHSVASTLHAKWIKFKDDRGVFMEDMQKHLERSVYGQRKAKRTIEHMIAQWISGNGKGDCFGFEGPPGTGKTSLAKRGLANCLKDANGSSRPFAFIALGGSTNGAFLEGHSYTYVGSLWGRLVDILMETKCMNPIIFFDELDKVSATEHGKEIIGILTHITDPTQNEEFSDKYFSGIKIDFSKVLFIFSYNDPSKIDPILKDRIHAVKFQPLTKSEKKEVARKHLIPEIAEIIGISQKDILIDDDIIEFIVDNYTNEAGARRLKEHLFYIIRELNLRHLLAKNDVKSGSDNRSSNVLYEEDRNDHRVDHHNSQKNTNSNIRFPIRVTRDMLVKDIFKEKILHRETVILKSPKIGVINGMYASTSGLGGITIIECFRVPSSTPLTLELTGNQGKVMKESMSVSKTIVWNLLPQHRQVELQREWKEYGSWGLHVHCPEGSVPKDGPSAGTAITVAILSCILKLEVNNTVAITGEIDLNGRVCQIGGLAAKVKGAKLAGVKMVLFPKDNEQDLRQILQSEDNPFDENFDYLMVESIKDLLPLVFHKDDVDVYLS